MFFESVLESVWKVRGYGFLMGCGFLKFVGGAAMALNVLKVQVMWVGKCLESSGVWVFKSAWKVRG